MNSLHRGSFGQLMARAGGGNDARKPAPHLSHLRGPRRIVGWLCVMGERGYMLVEVPVESRLWPDLDLIVRVVEYVRRNFRSIVPELPSECEVDLLAAG